MSSEVWNIAQQQKAHDTYDSYNKTTNIWGQKTGKSNTFTQLDGLKKITSMCRDMITSFYELQDDQNQYVIELENLDAEYGVVKGDVNTQIDSLLSEIKVMEAKEQNGTITDEEAKELADKKEELEKLFKSSDEKCSDANSEMNTKKQELQEKYLAKQNIAIDYGQTAKEKGEPWAKIDTEVKDDEIEKYSNAGMGFLCCNINKVLKANGLKAVNTGEELLDKVNESGKTFKTIANK